MRKTPRKRFNPDPCHWTKTKKGNWKQKEQYESEQEAQRWLRHHKLTDMISYLCPICNKWHNGHNKCK